MQDFVSNEKRVKDTQISPASEPDRAAAKTTNDCETKGWHLNEVISPVSAQ